MNTVIKNSLVMAVIMIIIAAVSATAFGQVDRQTLMEAERLASEHARELELENQMRKAEVERHMQTAADYEERGMLIEAKAEYEMVLEIEPGNRDASGRLAKLDSGMEKAVKKEISSKLSKGINEYKKGNYADAVKIFEEVIDKDPGNKQAVKYMAKARAAVSAESEFGVREVTVEGEKIVLDNVQKSEQLYAEGYLYFKDERYEESIPFFQKSLELNPDHANARRHLEMSLTNVRKTTDKIWDDEKDAYFNQVGQHWMVKKKKIGDDKTYKRVSESEQERKSAAKLKIEKELQQVVPSIKLKDANLKYVVKHLSGLSGVNILLDPAAAQGMGDQTITISLTDIPLMEAIKYIVRAKGLVYRIDDYAVIITDAANVSDEEMETRYYQLAAGVTSGSTFTTTFADEAGGTGTMGRAAGLESTKTIQDVLEESGVPFPEGSKIFLDKRTGILIVRNVPRNLSIIEDVLQKLDVVPYQIEIESKFVEMTEAAAKELGIEWMLTDRLKLGGDDIVANTRPWADSLGKPQYGQYGGNWGREGVTKGVRFLEDSTGEPAGNIMRISAVLGVAEFSAILHALDQKGDVNVLSSPKVTTVNNSQAQIKVVDEIIYPTEFDVTPPSTNDAGTVITPAVIIPSAFETRETGILLSVIPTVGNDKKTITLAMIPEVSDLTGWINYGTAVLPARQPIFQTRNVSTSVVVNDGDTVVMGGLIREEKTGTDDKVPIIGDIPLLGRLFRNETKTTQKMNLIIFVTAKLITPRGDLLREYMGEMGKNDADSKPLVK
ncbi:MAG: tetratricopeptide repeat protein [bacterium]|nr:tetratricopeptide repeat protein [bacterium]